MSAHYNKSQSLEDTQDEQKYKGYLVETVQKY